MEKLIDRLSAVVAEAFSAAGYDPACGRVTVSNRPDLCEFQCNGAMPAAKQHHKAPLVIAQDVVDRLQDGSVFASAEAVKPGFINLRVQPAYLAAHLEQMRQSERLGVTGERKPRGVVLDYGGPNVAKPLHIGHLRSAIIGESIKRIYRYFGDNVVGDIHLGDWGLQIGLIIAELERRKPDLPYFDESFTGPYLRAGGDLPHGQRPLEGGRALRRPRSRDHVCRAAAPSRLLCPVAPHHAGLRGRSA